MARKYTRDARGRFASGGGGGSSRPARKAAPTRAGNRLNRDNSGRITGIGRDGATARGGRLKTASGKKRATQTASLKSPGFRSGTIAKGGRGVSGSVARSLAATKRGRAKPSASPKSYGRGVDSAKVERMLERVRAGRSYQARTRRLRDAKEAAGRKTRERAVDFLAQQGGFKKAGTVLGRTKWEAPAGLTRAQATRNIADRLPKQPRRSTARTGNKKLVTRAERRANKAEYVESLRRNGVSQRFGVQAPPISQSYDSSTGRGSKRLASASGRLKKQREVVRTLRGLGRNNTSKITRGTARQRTIGGGTKTTYGRFRPA